MSPASPATPGGPRRARIEIIPLIDVIFFLLATFVLFTLSLNKLQSLPVELPQAKPAARPDPDDQSVVLQISANGTAFWNREPITLADIPARLLSYKASAPSPRILVSGDTTARFGDAVRALDQIREAGIAQVSIETIDRPAGR
jgi:biopolymer transport protein ExbD